MKKNWLTLYSDTFLWVKNDLGIFYNTNSYKIFKFANTNHIYDLCNQLLQVDNLYSVEILNELLSKKDTVNWIKNITDNGFGYYTENKKYYERPISFMPICKIQHDLERYKWEMNSGIPSSILNNLHEISIYLNGSTYGSSFLFRQTLYPLLQSDINIDLNKVLTFCRNSKNQYLSSINLIGSILGYPNYIYLLDELNKLSTKINLVITYDDFKMNIHNYLNIGRKKEVYLTVLCSKIENVDFKLINNTDSFVFFTFLIFSIKDYNFLKENSLLSPNTQSYPIFRNNLEFIKSLLFINENDFNELELEKREIFIRQKLNVFDFGKLTIMPDGYVYANVNKHLLGCINDSPIDLVYKEFLTGESWLYTRNYKPCNNCIYQFLCPSPSNYEIAIGKPNLCHIQP